MSKERIFTEAEVTDIVARYTATPLERLTAIAAAHHTRQELVRQELVKAGVTIRLERHDPCNVPAKKIPGLGPHLSRAERTRNQYGGLVPRVGR